MPSPCAPPSEKRSGEWMTYICLNLCKYKIFYLLHLGSKLRHGLEMVDLVSTNRVHVTY